jgi:hypothetical protein
MTSSGLIEMYILDTDHLSLIRRNGADGQFRFRRFGNWSTRYHTRIWSCISGSGGGMFGLPGPSIGVRI